MRIFRHFVHALIIVLTLIVGATAAAVIVSQTAWFKGWLRGYIERQANQYLNGTLSIQRLGGNLFFGLELENIGLSMDGSEVVAVKDLGLDYNVFQLIARGLSVDNIRLNKPVIYLRREGDTWSLTRLIKKQAEEADREGPLQPIDLEDIGITDGSVVFDGPVGTSGVEVPKRFDHLDAKLSFKYEPVHYSIEITQVSFRGSDPAIALNALSGGVAFKEDTMFVEKLAIQTEESSLSLGGSVQHYLTKPVFNLQISSDKLSLPEIARLVPALAGVKLQPSFDVKAEGPLDALGVTMNVQSTAGDASGKLVADLLAPDQSVAGNLSVRHLDLGPILANPRQKSDITADAQVELHGAAFSNLDSLRGHLRLTAPRLVAAGYAAEQVTADATVEGRLVTLNGRASAYGVTATTAGRVTLPAASDGPVAYDLHGRAAHVDLRRLPRDLNVPPAATDINADYHVVGSASAKASRTEGDLKFQPSTIAGAKIAGGGTAGFALAGKDVEYRVDATVADVNLRRIGEAFKVPALATDRYESAVNGHITASGHGTTPATMDVTASGTLTDSAFLGGRVPQLAFDATLAADTAHVKANGSFAGFDPAVLSGKPAMKGTVGGTLDVDATLTGVSAGVTADSVQAGGRVTLEPSTVGGLAIDHATVDADYHDSLGQIRTLEVVGRDVNVQATGTLALNETDQSNLTFHADTPSLEEIGKLVDQPVKGIAKVDGTIKGNKRNLQIAGHLIADGVAYNENGALTVASDYSVEVPDLTFERAKVVADTHATFVTVGGQNINELTAKTDYHDQEIVFDASAKQPQRTLAANGSVLLHPEHQEVHLQRLALDTAGQSWQTAPGAQPTVQYGNDTITVKDVRLVDGKAGDQQLSADGTFGRPGDALHVTLTNVDLAGVDAVLLRPPQFSGRLTATGTVTGTKDAPLVKADFAVDHGGFRTYRYDALSGTVDYHGKGVTLDAKLQQNPEAWLTAKGYVPTAAFAGTGLAATHVEAGGPEDRIDLKVESSPINLGLVQGFTTALTDVTGAVQANLHITGAAADPHPDGTVTIQNAAFTVAPTGVKYTDLDANILLQADRVRVEQIRVLDNQKKPLLITGDLALHELQVGGVDISIKANDFKVIDNKLGNVRVNSDLRIAGELQNPRIEGDLGVSTGQINLDEILALAGDSAYPTTATDYGSTEPATGEAPKPSVFDALQLSVHVTVPNDLVVKASDLTTPGSPIGLGAVNLTLGGDLWASKTPWDQVRLVGTVNTVRGTYDFQGRRFELQRDGIIRFVGDDQLNPNLDIKAKRVIQGVEAMVNVRGTLQQPEIRLSSVPPLPEADILAMIVFNQQLNELGEGQQINLAQRASAMAIGAVAGQLAQSIGDALNVDTFEIQMAPESGNAASVAIGQQLGERLYVKLQQGLGDHAETNFILEYELTNWLRFRSNILQGASTQASLFRRSQGSGVDLIFFFSY